MTITLTICLFNRARQSYYAIAMLLSVIFFIRVGADVLIYVLCTWVHILEYSDVLCTRILLAWCTQYLHSNTFIKYLSFQITFGVRFPRSKPMTSCYYFDINDIDYIFILSAGSWTWSNVLYHLSVSCIKLLNPFGAADDFCRHA